MIFSINDFLKDVPIAIVSSVSAGLGIFLKEIFVFFRGKRKERLELQRGINENDSLTLKDNLIVTKYNKEEYEDLMNKYESLEAKYKQAMQLLNECEREMNEWRRRYNVFKTLRNEEV